MVKKFKNQKVEFIEKEWIESAEDWRLDTKSILSGWKATCLIT